MQPSELNFSQLILMEYEINEKQLVGEILNGNRESYRIFINQYIRLVNHVVFKMVSNDCDREDICQDIFIKAYQNLGSFNFDAKLSTWLARIAYNTCLNHLEKKQIPLYQDVVSEGADIDDNLSEEIHPDQVTVNRNLAYRLCQEIDELPVSYGLILSLYHLQEMTYKEISDILSMPEGTVKSYLFRARKLLKDRLVKNYCREDIWL